MNVGQTARSSPTYEADGTAGSGSLSPVWSTLAGVHVFTYDALGRQVKDETQSSGSALWHSVAAYDGWNQTVTDPNGHATDYAYDAFGQLIAVTEHNNPGGSAVTYVTAYQYDTVGNLTQVADHAGNVTSMSYDLLGRKTAMTDPDMGSWSYAYNNVGSLTRQQDGNGNWIYLEYDNLHRLTGKRQDSASGSWLATYVYDTLAKGQLYATKAYDTGGNVTVETRVSGLDNRYRPTERQWMITGQGTFRMAYAYNAADQGTSVTYPGNNANGLGEVVTQSYNSMGQLTGVSGGWAQYVAAAAYNARGQLVQLSNGAGFTRQYVYDSATLRLSVIRAGTAAPWTNRQELHYAYDNNGNITSLTDARNSGQVQSFGYDWLDRLTSASTNAAGTGQYSHAYSYDAIGNITSMAGNSYTYSSAQPHAVIAAHGNAYGYDANGNQTSRTIGGVIYTQIFDQENRLSAVKQGSTTMGSFLYDANGNRVAGTVSGVTTVYIDGVYEWQPGGANTRYYTGPDGVVAIRRTGYASGNGVFSLLRDHLGSSSVIINSSGTVVKREYYYPYGGNRGTAFSSLTTKRFTGQYHEAGLPGGEGLSYYNARWYDGQLGRFVSADTIVPDPGNPQALNRFAYVVNNPLRLVDPSGHAYAQHSGGGGGLCGPYSGCYVSTQLEPDCRKNTCRDPQITSTIHYYAGVYEIPEDLLGTTLLLEAIDDQSFLGEAADFVNSIGLGLYRMPTYHGSATPYVLGWSTLLAVDTVERWHGSPGIGAQNIHIDTVRETEQYFAQTYPDTLMSWFVQPGKTMPEVLETLFSTDGNIRYAAAHLRLLADLRTGSTEPHVDNLTDLDMSVIFGAYRAGIELGYGGINAYQNASVIGKVQGTLFLKRLQEYRNR